MNKFFQTILSKKFSQISFKHCSKNHHSISLKVNRGHFKNFYNIQKRTFAMPLSFKNKINTFYKFVHPDVLGEKCPNELRKENEKSVQNLNAYIESLDKGTKFESKNLLFYIALEQKDNKDETKVTFPKLEIKLDEIKPNTSQSNRATIQINLNAHVDELISRIKKIQNDALKGKKIDENFDKKSVDSSFSTSTPFGAIKDESDEKIKILKDDEILSNIKKKLDENYYKNKVMELRMKNKKRQFAQQIDRAMNSKTDFFENRISPDPLAVQLVNSIKSFKEIRFFGDNFFPVSMIFFDEKLDEKEIQTFISTMKLENLKTSEKITQKIEFRKMALEMCQPSNLVRIYVSDKYSYDNMPGYLTVPFNFDFNELIDYYNENKNDLYRLKSRFVEESKALEIVKQNILSTFKFRGIKIVNKKNQALSTIQDIQINLKKLFKILNEKYKEFNFKEFELKLLLNSQENKSNESDNIEEERNFFTLDLELPINEKSIESSITAKLRV